MEKKNEKIVQEMKRIEKILETKFNKIVKEMDEKMNTVEEKTGSLIYKAHKSNIINFWVDAFKYGIATAICIVPVYMLLNFLKDLIVK